MLRRLTSSLDERVKAVASVIFRAGLEIAFIGGGHNNALPLLAATAETFGQPAVASNLDPHSDARPVEEGRHSGNGCSVLLSNTYL